MYSTKWGCRNAPDSWEGLPVLARGVSKSGCLAGRAGFWRSAPRLGRRPRVQHRQPGNYWRPARVRSRRVRQARHPGRIECNAIPKAFCTRKPRKRLTRQVPGAKM